LDRCALFVDAGYALGDGALAVHGTRNRDSVSWDYAGLLKLLSSVSRDRTGLPLLRCYWYDVAAAGSRVAEHDALADLPGVKLRLSKARPSRKEGVEAEIRKDLTALARNRSVSDVIVVSAEEDLAPVIAEVQEFGVRALLLHIGADGGWAGSRALRQECDEVIEISPSHLRPYVDLISGAEPQLAVAGYRELTAASAQASGPHAVLATAGARLFDSPGSAGYERAAQLVTAGGHAQDPRSPLPGADMRTPSVHEGQAAPPRLRQTMPEQPQAAVPYHQSDMGGPGPRAAADASFGQPAFGGTGGAHSANGRSGTGHAHDFSQRSMTPDGLAHGGPPLAPGADHAVTGLAPAPGSAGLGAHAFPGMGPGSQPSGAPGNGVPASGGHANGVPASAAPPGGVPGNGMPAHGMSGTGLSTHGAPGGGLPPAERAAPVIQPGVISQGGYVGGQLGTGPAGPPHQLSGQPVAPGAPGQAGQYLTGQPLPGQPLAGQQPQTLQQPQHATPALPQSASALPQEALHTPGAGQHSARALGGQQHSLAAAHPGHRVVSRKDGEYGRCKDTQAAQESRKRHTASRIRLGYGGLTLFHTCLLPATASPS